MYSSPARDSGVQVSLSSTISRPPPGNGVPSVAPSNTGEIVRTPKRSESESANCLRESRTEQRAGIIIDNADRTRRPPQRARRSALRLGVCIEQLPIVDSEDQRERLQTRSSHSTLPLTSLARGPRRLPAAEQRAGIIIDNVDRTRRPPQRARRSVLRLGVCIEQLPIVDSEDQRERLQTRSSHSTLPLTSLARGPRCLPAESAPAYRAFRVYLNQGPSRSLDQAWQFFRAGSVGKAPKSARRPGHWSRWCARYEWVARAAAYDQFLAENRIAKADRKRQAEADRELLPGERGGHSDSPAQADDTAGRRGRPSIIISDQLRERFCDVVLTTGSIETAIKLTGLDHGTYYRWQSRVRKGEGTQFQTKFVLAVDAACADTKMRREVLLWKHMKKEWRAIAFWLSRKYPDEYGRRRKIRFNDEEGDDGLEKEVRKVCWVKAPAVKPGTPTATCDQ